MATTQVELVTPTAVLFSGQAEGVVARSEGGDITFLADHMPHISALQAYEVRIDGPEGGGGDQQLRFQVGGGFVEVSHNRVIVLCDSAEPSASAPLGAPGSGAPGSGAPGSGAPGSGAPGSGAPGSGAPGSGAPGSGAPGSGAPGSGASGA